VQRSIAACSFGLLLFLPDSTSVTSSMNSAMGQLENLYNAIRGTIVKHIDSGFIPDYIDSNLNDPDQIPKLETRNTFDRSGLQNNFGNIGRVFQTYGYT